MGSPAAVTSPRTGSATIWAACLPVAHPSLPDPPRPSCWPVAHPSVPDPPRPSCWPVGCPIGGTVGCESAPDPPDPLPLPAALAEGRLRNQSDVAAVAPATGPAFDAPVFEMPGLEMAALEMAGTC